MFFVEGEINRLMNFRYYANFDVAHLAKINLCCLIEIVICYGLSVKKAHFDISGCPKASVGLCSFNIADDLYHHECKSFLPFPVFQ